MNSASILLRPWLNAGFEYLLAEDALRAGQLRGRTEPQRAQDPPGGPAPSPVRKGSRAPAVPPAQAHGQEKSRAAASRSVAAPPEAPEIIPLEKWSAPWQDLWRRHKIPPRPLVVWTYPGLGEDLTGHPDAGRRRVMRSILEGLAHPSGTHVFWPHRLPGEGDAAPVFWSAVGMLSPRAVMVLGSESRDALGLPRSMRPYAHRMLWGRLVVQLHRPESLASDDALLSSTQAFLASVLRFCAARQVRRPE